MSDEIEKEKEKELEQEQDNTPIKQARANTEICKFLRGKNGLGRLEGGENPWHHVDKVTTTFTCLCTGEPFGPDYELADAARCSRERSCCIIAPA